MSDGPDEERPEADLPLRPVTPLPRDVEGLDEPEVTAAPSVFGVPTHRMDGREPAPRLQAPSPPLVSPVDPERPPLRWGRIEDPVTWQAAGPTLPVESGPGTALPPDDPWRGPEADPAPAGAAWIGAASPDDEWHAADADAEAGSPAGPSGPPARHRRSRNPIDRFTEGWPHWLRVTVDWIVTIVGAIAIVLLVKAYVVNPYRIPSSSMEPTLHCAFGSQGCQARFSDRVLANRFIYHFTSPKRGDIIVFETPPAAEQSCGAGGTFVKRLIGLPGETIEVRLIRGDGYVYIDGKQLNEPYVEEDRRQVSTEYGPYTIPAGQYFMMGDNREASCDSREWGTVPRANLIGKVFMTYWPPNRISFR